MKKFIIAQLLLFCAFQYFAVGQENEKHFYIDHAEEIKIAHFDEIRDNITLVGSKSQNTPSLTGVGAIGAILGVVIGELVPVVVEKVGLLAYNPKNYISEYGTSYVFKKDSLRSTNTIDKIIFTRTGKNANAQSTVSSFTFGLENVSMADIENLSGYRAIALEEYQNNYTQVKLKNSGKKMTALVEMTLIYFDQLDKKQELKLQPYKLSGIIPSGTSGKLISIDSEKRNHQIIPPIKFIETISIKITEVNDRKKDWDKYLELFNSQKGNISSFLIDQLN